MGPHPEAAGNLYSIH